MTHIIALDLGTKTGFAEYADGSAYSEQWVLWKPSKATKDLTMGRRIRELNKKMRALFASPEYTPDAIYYEEVRRHLGTDAAHVYGALLSQIEALCLCFHIRLVPVGVKTIKKHATGNGNATKTDMLAAAKRLWGIENISEDEADALGLLHYALQKETTK